MKLIKLEHEITIEDINKRYNLPNQKIGIIIHIKDENKKILFQQRGPKSRGDKFLYEDIGGRVESTDKSFKETAIRELKEEIGEAANIEISNQIGIYTVYKNDINWIFIIYLGKYIDGEIKIMEPEKCLGYKFFTKEEALNSDQVTDSCKYLIRELKDY